MAAGVRALAGQRRRGWANELAGAFRPTPSSFVRLLATAAAAGMRVFERVCSSAYLRRLDDCGVPDG